MGAIHKTNKKNGCPNSRIKNMTCMHINADTLTNKMSEFEFIVNNHNPDIIGLCEAMPKIPKGKYTLKNLT